MVTSSYGMLFQKSKIVKLLANDNRIDPNKVNGDGETPLVLVDE